MQLFANPYRQEDEINCAIFTRIVNDYPSITFFQPSPEKAPWHVQCIIDGTSPQVVNFWPHVLKGQRDGLKSVVGEAAIRGIIDGAVMDAQEEPFDVIEG